MTNLSEVGGWPALLTELLERRDLPTASARAAMTSILAGESTAAQLVGFIVALRAKGETAEEVSGLLDAVFEAATLVPLSEELRARAGICFPISFPGNTNKIKNEATISRKPKIRATTKMNGMGVGEDMLQRYTFLFPWSIPNHPPKNDRSCTRSSTWVEFGRHSCYLYLWRCPSSLMPLAPHA